MRAGVAEKTVMMHFCRVRCGVVGVLVGLFCACGCSGGSDGSETVFLCNFGDVFSFDVENGHYTSLYSAPRSSAIEGITGRSGVPFAYFFERDYPWFRSDQGNPKSTLKRIDLRTGVVKTVMTSDRQCGRPALSHDGQKIAFAVHRDGLYLYELSSGTVKRLCEAMILAIGISSNLSWSPDDARIAFAAGDIGERHAVMVFDMDAGSAMELTEGTRCEWSPVDDRIVFVRYGGEQALDKWYIADSSGRNLVEIPTEGKPNIRRIVWGPRGKALYAIEPCVLSLTILASLGDYVNIWRYDIETRKWSVVARIMRAMDHMVVLEKSKKTGRE